MTEKYAGSPDGMSRLSQRRDLEVASDSPDIRGWDVATLDERTIGTVDDLIVDTRVMKARYMVVDLARTGRCGAADGLLNRSGPAFAAGPARSILDG